MYTGSLTSGLKEWDPNLELQRPHNQDFFNKILPQLEIVEVIVGAELPQVASRLSNITLGVIDPDQLRRQTQQLGKRNVTAIEAFALEEILVKPDGRREEALVRMLHLRLVESVARETGRTEDYKVFKRGRDEIMTLLTSLNRPIHRYDALRISTRPLVSGIVYFSKRFEAPPFDDIKQRMSEAVCRAATKPPAPTLIMAGRESAETTPLSPALRDLLAEFDYSQDQLGSDNEAIEHLDLANSNIDGSLKTKERMSRLSIAAYFEMVAKDAESQSSQSQLLVIMQRIMDDPETAFDKMVLLATRITKLEKRDLPPQLVPLHLSQAYSVIRSTILRLTGGEAVTESPGTKKLGDITEAILTVTYLNLPS